MIILLSYHVFLFGDPDPDHDDEQVNCVHGRFRPTPVRFWDDETPELLT